MNIIGKTKSLLLNFRVSTLANSNMYNGMCMYNGLLIPCKHANIPANTAPKNTGGYLITFNLTSLAGSLRLVFLIWPFLQRHL